MSSDTPVTATRHSGRQSRSTSSPDAASASSDRPTNLYVGGLHDSVGDPELLHKFSPFGQVLSAKVMLHIHTGQSRGIGFVKFVDHDSAVAALKACHRTLLAGQRIMVRFADSRADYRPGAKTDKVFVRNLPFDVTGTALRSYLERFGRVKDCSMHVDTAGFKSGGHGARTRMAYVRFENVREAEEAAQAIHGTKPFPSCQAVVMAKLAESDQKRQERRTQRTPSAVAPDSSGTLRTRDSSSGDDQQIATVGADSRTPVSDWASKTSGERPSQKSSSGGDQTSSSNSDKEKRESSESDSAPDPMPLPGLTSTQPALGPHIALANNVHVGALASGAHSERVGALRSAVEATPAAMAPPAPPSNTVPGTQPQAPYLPAHAYQHQFFPGAHPAVLGVPPGYPPMMPTGYAPYPSPYYPAPVPPLSYAVPPAGAYHPAHPAFAYGTPPPSLPSSTTGAPASAPRVNAQATGAPAPSVPTWPVAPHFA